MGGYVMGDPVTTAAALVTDCREQRPATAPERVLADLLADLLQIERPAPDAHFFDDLGADSMLMAQFCARVRKRPDLPAISMRDVYQHPTIRGLLTAVAGTGPDPVPTLETRLADVLAEVLHVDAVPTHAHFFDDLGADSMTMTQFCARVRKRADLPAVSIKEVYQHPTITGLAAALGPAGDAAQPPPRVPAPANEQQPHAVSTPSYLLCAVVQLLTVLGYTLVAGEAADMGVNWIVRASTAWDAYLRAVLVGATFLGGMCAVPILAKWVLIGRWEPQQIRIWSLAYVRFWIVKTLIHANPAAMFLVGSPLYPAYLRALGARVGRNVLILSRHIPVCTDLLMIGEGTVIRKDSFFQGYRAWAGFIETGRISIGREVFIGEKVVLDIDTSIGDGAQVGHTSALHRGQSLPAGGRYHGSPVQRTQVNYLSVGAASCSAVRRAVFSIGMLLKLLLVYMPLAEGSLYLLLHGVPALKKFAGPGADGVTSPALYVDSLILSAVVFFGFAVAGLLFVLLVPRVLKVFMKPDRVYPLYGFHYGLQRTVARITNVKFFTWLCGDSSYIVYYLRALGYDLNRVEQTGSNFGQEVSHETPFLSSVGSGTMVADGLSMMNADFSSTSFRVSRTAIGAHNYLGNNIAYPPGGRTGENCLLATKVMIPLDGKLREGVGLLGSPPFEIPRSVERDSQFDHLLTGGGFRRRLAAKNRYNLRSMALFLLVRWVHVWVLTTLALAAIDLEGMWGFAAVAGLMVASIVVTPLYFVLVERWFTWRPLRPRICSIYDPYFWWHERLWKVPDTYLNLYNGTPFKTLIWRLLGVRVGRQVFDDGVFITERTLTSIGDGTVLNHGSKIQCHSQEDGTFKMDRVRVGAGCTLGVGAFVHYAVTIGDRAVLAPDSFLMKGEEIPPGADWGGNPARDMPENPPSSQPPARTRRTTAGAVHVARHRTESPRPDARHPDSHRRAVTTTAGEGR